MNFQELQRAAHDNAVRKGFWHNPSMPEKLCLVHAEVSELLEEYRKVEHEEPSTKCPELTREAEEMADILLRVMDIAEYRGVDLSRAIEVKHAYNINRPHMHGKQF